ncbi:hypothetical protein [Flavobacterium sp.]|uniref:hypothetical protein n=1 Tax=Flavobacterium sp. TaxID=239 RepID=UPI0011FCA3A3|nr:hypothetical protein [Flavobacterium sp.]RZJ70194.1 MAG: hypothetical protein EOO49_14510 [Flavobacterium sp.]
MALNRDNIGPIVLTALYFIVSVSEVICELLVYRPLIFVLKPLMPFLLMVLYFVVSDRKNVLFFFVMTLSLITNVLFIPDSKTYLFYGLVVFLVHRILLLYYMMRLLKLRDFIPAIIATIPFLMVFFYTFMITNGIPEESFFVLIFQNILISVICGISFSHYIMHDDKRNSWLLLCGILFGCLHFIVFVEKFYLSGFSPIIFRPLAMGLNAMAFYTFYEFVVATEKSNGNDA